MDVGRCEEVLLGEYDDDPVGLVVTAAVAAANAAADADDASKFIAIADDEDRLPGGVNGLCGGSGWFGGWWLNMGWWDVVWCPLAWWWWPWVWWWWCATPAKAAAAW